MQIQMIGNSLVIEPTAQAALLSKEDFAQKEVVVDVAPAFYVALNKNGLMERCVSVTTPDRKAVAALVGNWVAEGYNPVPCDLRAYAKHLRNLVNANKQSKGDEQPEAKNDENIGGTPAPEEGRQAGSADGF